MFCVVGAFEFSVHGAQDVCNQDAQVQELLFCKNIILRYGAVPIDQQSAFSDQADRAITIIKSMQQYLRSGVVCVKGYDDFVGHVRFNLQQGNVVRLCDISTAQEKALSAIGGSASRCVIL